MRRMKAEIEQLKATIAQRGGHDSQQFRRTLIRASNRIKDPHRAGALVDAINDAVAFAEIEVIMGKPHTPLWAEADALMEELERECATSIM